MALNVMLGRDGSHERKSAAPELERELEDLGLGGARYSRQSGLEGYGPQGDGTGHEIFSIVLQYDGYLGLIEAL
jgi:hypothetical protein